MKTRVIVKSVTKYVQSDNYENGCNSDSGKWVNIECSVRSCDSITDVFRTICKDSNIQPSDITTMDSNVYCDTKTGTRVVEDNMTLGLFRCSYSRTENSRGRVPTEQETADFQAGKIDLKLADYDIYFTLQVVGLTEAKLADYLGVNNY